MNLKNLYTLVKNISSESARKEMFVVVDGEARAVIDANLNTGELALRDPKAAKNELFPLKFDYQGPREGLFTYIHHEQPIEYTTDEDIMDRVFYVKTQKDKREQALRAEVLRFVRPEELPHKALQEAYKELLAVTAYSDAWYHARNKWESLWLDWHYKAGSQGRLEFAKGLLPEGLDKYQTGYGLDFTQYNKDFPLKAE